VHVPMGCTQRQSERNSRDGPLPDQHDGQSDNSRIDPHDAEPVPANEKTNRERHKAPTTLIRRPTWSRGSRLLPSMFANRSALPGTSPDRRAPSQAPTIQGEWR
jgi:hypothetical protein